VNGTRWDGGAATCTAQLRYFAQNMQAIIIATFFDVAG
jgi:hypothetical protein